MVVVVEAFIAFVSGLAAYLHFKGSGHRVTTPTFWHIVHVIFSIFYVVCHLMDNILRIMSPCLCQPVKLQYLGYHGAFYLAVGIFIR